jgi:hypothetical protein
MLNKKWFLVVIIVLVFVSLACNLSDITNSSPVQVPATGGEQPDSSQPSTDQQVQQPQQGAAPTPQVIIITATPEPTAIPSKPVSIWQGLSSLNSYRMVMRLVNNGPTASDQNQNSMLVESGSDGDSSHTRYETTSSSSDDPEVSTSTTDHYVIGNRTCDVDDSSEVTLEDTDLQAQEITDAWVKLIDILPMTNDPVFVGEEMLNGVLTNHFTFNVTGLGAESGAEVVASNGEYWLAQDGQYVVKYSVIMETRNGPAGDPNTHTMHSEFYIEVTDINQPIVITMPSNCQ